MKKINIFKVLILGLVTSTAGAQVQKAQTVQIGNTSTITPNASAALQVDDITRGFLMPRMNTTERLAITTPATGLQVYDTVTKSTWTYNGTLWIEAGAANNSSKFTNDPATGAIYLTSQSDGSTARSAYSKVKFYDNGDNMFGDDSPTSITPRTNIKTARIELKTTAEFNGDPTLVDMEAIGRFGGTNQYFPHNQVNGNKASGTRLAPTSVSGGDFLLSLTSGNYGVSGWHYNTARISLQSETTPTATSNPTMISFATTSPNSLENSEKMRLTANGTVAIGTIAPASSALLDVSSTSRGFLPPRMNKTQMNSIPSAVDGLVVYCTNCVPTKGLRIFNGTEWVDALGNALPPAAFTFTGSFYHSPTFTAGKVMGSDNALFLEINVTTPGKINFSSTTVNGYSFTFNSEIDSAGISYIQLVPVGTQTAYNASGDMFTITGVGTTTQQTVITIQNTPFGSAFTSHSNGTENFSTNTACATRALSTTTAINCPATVTVGSNTYNTAFINGQCWFKENLNEVPTAPCTAAINTGCNTWLNTTLTDVGAYGYFNTTTTNGTAGWRTTVAVAGDGLLYQWSAAMNGSTTERAKGACPAGWHIPSDCEWKYLEHGLGMTIADQNTLNATRLSGDVGGKLSTFTRATAASAIGTGTNSSGFTALFSGRRNPSNGQFTDRGTTAMTFWSSTLSSGNNLSRELSPASNGIISRISVRNWGLAVRCLKDM